MSDNRVMKREEIAEEYKWNMEDMFASDELWEKEYDQTMDLCKEMKAFQGTLGDSAKQLLGYMKKQDEAEIGRAHV